VQQFVNEVELVDTDLPVFVLHNLWVHVKMSVGLTTQIFTIITSHLMLQCVDKH
jgi:hypothetical protein